MPEETPPDVANLRGEEDVDWLVARRRKLGIDDRDVDGTVDWSNPMLDQNQDSDGIDTDTDADDE